MGVGSILVGYYEGPALRYAGRVGTGTGWSGAFSLKLRRDLERIEIDKPPFDPAPRGWLRKQGHWVRPQLVAEVEFTEWTRDGRVRHPSLKGFRKDKTAREVTREAELRTSPPERATKSILVFPRLKVTSADLQEIYSAIAEWALPHVKDRPLTLVRLREPITRADALRTQATFVHHNQRDQRFVPATVPRISIPEKKKIGEYCYVDSRESLLALIGAGVVEWHVWNARVDDVEHPDRVVFDIDPGAGVEWARVVSAARDVKAELRSRDLDSWVKTTGGSGLHVVAPFRAEHNWDDVFQFSRDVATRVCEARPQPYILSFGKSDRSGKILIDYKRNYRTSIAVAGLSVRARPSAPVGVPLTWEELGRTREGDRWNVLSIRDRLSRMRKDPWSGYWTSKQRLRI